jgi:hypothetical protein
MSIAFLLENQKERGHLKDPDIDGKVTDGS